MEELAGSGGYARFDVRCARDLREEVGRLVAREGWVLRELSWRRPSLETLFANIALDLDRGETA